MWGWRGWRFSCAFLTWPHTHLTLSLSKTNPLCQRGNGLLPAGSSTVTATSAPYVTPLPPSTRQGHSYNQQRMKMLVKRPYFPSRLFAGGAACGFTQLKQWEFHTLTRSARCPLSCAAASASPKMLQPNPITLNTPPPFSPRRSSVLAHPHSPDPTSHPSPNPC